MKKIPLSKRKELSELISKLPSNPTSEMLLSTFEKGRDLYFGDVLDVVQVYFEMTKLDVKFIVVSMKNSDYRNRKFKIKMPETRPVSLKDFETIYTYIILAAFGNNPDQELSKVECIHTSIFGDNLNWDVVYKDPVRLFVEYSGKHLAYVKKRDFDGASYQVTELTPGTLDTIRTLATNVIPLGHGKVMIRTSDPDFEETLLQLDM